MVRIRKPRLAATSAGKPELHECSNGGLHLHAVSKANPTFQDPRSSLLLPPSIIKQDHLLLAGSGYGATHRLSQKQPPAEEVSLSRKPYILVSSGVESRDNGEGLMLKKGEANPRATRVLDVERHEVKHIHMHNDDGDVKSKLGLLGSSAEGDKLAEACKKARHGIPCKGSALHEQVNAGADPAMVIASGYPSPKVRPLELILSSDYSPSTAPKLPLPMCPSNSSNAMPGTRSVPPLRKFDKASPYALTKTPPLPSPATGPLIKQIADVKSRDEMRLIRHEVASSTLGNFEENRAAFDILLKSSNGPVPSWQGHRRPRSGGRGFNGPPNSAAGPGVNAVIQKEDTQENNPTEQKRKKPKQTKRKAIDILVSPCISVQAPSPAIAAGNGELRKQDSAAAMKNKSHTKKRPHLPSTSAACLLPFSKKKIGSVVTAGSLDAKRAATTPACTYDDHVASVAPVPDAAASDQGLQLDSMRCRRKDGRRWRCKEQVVKVGAPFCHYHTLKMREKHAASVARKLLKKLQGEVKIRLSSPDLSRSITKRRVRRSPSSAAGLDGYGGGCEAAAEGEKEEEEEEEENDNDEKQQKMLGKQQQKMLESLTLRRRWRKKCKPCIRRLHDIHDRAMPATTGGLDFFNPCTEDTSNLKDSTPVRSGSPLPECLLNTDPYEWRSDFP